jgi:hypothetical protein
VIGRLVVPASGRRGAPADCGPAPAPQGSEAAIVFGLKSAFIPGAVDNTGSITNAMAASKTLSPHEIHLNYKNMKELPVHEVKEPF